MCYRPVRSSVLRVMLSRLLSVVHLHTKRVLLSYPTILRRSGAQIPKSYNSRLIPARQLLLLLHLLQARQLLQPLHLPPFRRIHLHHSQQVLPHRSQRPVLALIRRSNLLPNLLPNLLLIQRISLLPSPALVQRPSQHPSRVLVRQSSRHQSQVPIQPKHYQVSCDRRILISECRIRLTFFPQFAGKGVPTPSKGNDKKSSAGTTSYKGKGNSSMSMLSYRGKGGEFLASYFKIPL